MRLTYQTPAETLRRGLMQLGLPIPDDLDRQIQGQRASGAAWETRPGGFVSHYRHPAEVFEYGKERVRLESKLKATQKKIATVRAEMGRGRLHTLGLEPHDVRAAMEEDEELERFVWRVITHEVGHFASAADVGAVPWYIHVLFERKDGRLRCTGGRCGSERPERLDGVNAVAGALAEAWAADDSYQPDSWNAFYRGSRDLRQFKERGGGMSVQQAVDAAAPMLRRLAPGRSALHYLLRERFDVEGPQAFETFVSALPRSEADCLSRLNA